MRWLFRFLIGLIVLVAAALGLSYVFLSDPDMPRDVLVQKYGQPPSQFTELPSGATAHFRDQGNRDAPAVILLHGSNASLHTWEPWVREFGDKLRVISVDLPGHGLTGPTPQADYTLNGMGAFVDEFATQMGLTSFALAGSSMGGAVAVKYAQAKPWRVTALILVDSGGIALPGMEPPIGVRIATTPVLNQITRVFPTRGLYEAGLKASFVNESLVTKDMVDRYWELNRGPGVRDATRKRFSTPWSELVAEAQKIEAALPAMTTRTLILWGREDKLVPVAAGEVFRSKIPGSQLIVYDKVGHIPQEEVPAKSAADVLAFLLPAPAPSP
jgi:pimeloyl-ACP methyl ester carboxylesterase